MPNVFEPDFDTTERRPGFSYRRARLGRQAGSRRLGASLFEIPPGEATFPYHYHHANEELLIVIDGQPELRTPDGWRRLERGEVVAFPVGAEGAHQVQNRSDEGARVLVISEMRAPEVSVYPDSDKVAAMDRAPGSPDREDDLFAAFGREHEVNYWEGEQPPPRE